jgi:hypothetical protein
MFIHGINLKGAKVIYNDWHINPNMPFNAQKWAFKEDILQIGCGNYLIDVGWYPELNPKGHFIIEVIYNYEWDSPIYKKKCNNYFLLKQYLQEAIDIVNTKQ